MMKVDMLSNNKNKKRRFWTIRKEAEGTPQKQLPTPTTPMT